MSKIDKMRDRTMEQSKTKFVRKSGYLYVLSCIDNYSKRKEFWLQQKRAKKPAGRDPYDPEINAYFTNTVRSAIYDYSREEQERAAGNLAWDIAKRYAWGCFGKDARWIIRGFEDMLSEQERQKLNNYLNKKKTTKTVAEEKVLPADVNKAQSDNELKLREMTCLLKMPPTSENVMKYAQELFYFSMDNPYDSDISAVPLLQMIEKNADFIGINNEQTAMFDMKTKNNNINKSLVKDVVKLYAEIGEEAWGTDCLNTDLMGSMSDMVATIIKKYDYSHKDLMELKYAAYSSQGSFAKQWGPEVAKHCKSPRSAHKRKVNNSPQNHWEL